MKQMIETMAELITVMSSLLHDKVSQNTFLLEFEKHHIHFQSFESSILNI